MRDRGRGYKGQEMRGRGTGYKGQKIMAGVRG